MPSIGNVSKVLHKYLKDRNYLNYYDNIKQNLRDILSMINDNEIQDVKLVLIEAGLKPGAAALLIKALKRAIVPS